MVQEALVESSRHPVRRIAPSEAEKSESLQRTRRDITALSADHLEAMRPVSKAEIAPAGKAWGIFGNEEDFRRHELAQHRMFLQNRQRFLDLNIPLGDK